MERFLWKKRDSQSKLWLSLIEWLPPVAEKRWRSGNLLSRLTWMYPSQEQESTPRYPPSLNAVEQALPNIRFHSSTLADLAQSNDPSHDGILCFKEGLCLREGGTESIERVCPAQ